MKIPVRTLSAQDAEILARTVASGIVHNGCVERHDLRWRSDALRTWELDQRSLGRKPEVTIRIDELDLSVVYVELLDGTRKIIKAMSTHPKYTQALSLYEHRKLKQKMREQRLRDRLVQMEDDKAFDLRIAYYAELGHADDPIAYRRLVGLRDQLAALRIQDGTPPPATAPAPAKPRKRKVSADEAAAEPASQPPADPIPTPATPAAPQPPVTPSTTDAAPAAAMKRIFIKRKPL